MIWKWLESLIRQRLRFYCISNILIYSKTKRNIYKCNIIILLIQKYWSLDLRTVVPKLSTCALQNATLCDFWWYQDIVVRFLWIYTILVIDNNLNNFKPSSKYTGRDRIKFAIILQLYLQIMYKCCLVTRSHNGWSITGMS